MAKFITVYHPELKETAVVAEGALKAKGGLASKGWVVYDPKTHKLAAEDKSAAATKAKKED